MSKIFTLHDNNDDDYEHVTLHFSSNTVKLYVSDYIEQFVSDLCTDIETLLHVTTHIEYPVVLNGLSRDIASPNLFQIDEHHNSSILSFYVIQS